VSKLFCLFFFSLFLFGNLVAQTDTTPPAATITRLQADSTPVKKDSLPVRHRRVLRDSTLVRKDTAIIKASKLPVPGDSLPTRDTALKNPLTVPPAAPAPVVPVDRSYWQHIFSINAFFHFTGKAVVEEIEVHRPKSRDTFFYLLVGILFYFALFRIFFEKYFSNLLTLFFRVSIRQQQIREQVLQAPQPSLLLNILFIVTGGLYAAYLLVHYHYNGGLNFWILYLNCMVALVVIYLVKFLVLKFCGWVFNISRGTDTYIFVVFLVNKMLGIFLLPFLILITFSGPQAGEIYITISLVMVFVFLLYRVFASYRPIASEIKLTPFQFFLYICAFEIAPLLLIYKVLLAYLEKGT